MGRDAVAESLWDEEPDEFDEYLEESLNKPSFRAAFEDAEERSRVLTSLVKLRKTMHLNQAEVARRMGTTQSSISELENGKTDPQLSTLQRYARAVTGRVRVRIELPSDCPWITSSCNAYEHRPSQSVVRVMNPQHRAPAHRRIAAWQAGAGQRVISSEYAAASIGKA
jgi:transcriptional regulator with XRE-family HTH domain